MGRHGAEGDERDTQRVKCPWRVIDDAGSGFSIGAIGGGIYHFASGWRNSPQGTRFTGAVSAMSARGVVTAGSFGVWAGMFATGDCTFAYMRGKHDPWNAIMSGGVTSATLAARSGPVRALQAGAVGAVMLGMIEGLMILMGRFGEQDYRPQPLLLPEMPDAPLPPKQNAEEVPAAAPIPRGSAVDLNTMG